MGLRVAYGLAVSLSISACSGGGGDPKAAAPESFTTLRDREHALLSAYYTPNADGDADRTLSLNLTGASAVPTMGRADYSGVAAFGENRVPRYAEGPGKHTPERPAADYYGQAKFNVDFDSSIVSAKITDFTDASHQLIDGEMTIEGLRINGNQLNGGKVDGTIEIDGALRNIETGTAFGVFLGNQGEAIHGNIALTREDSDGGTKSESGHFIAGK